jgi:predicted PurR-regulated permease PerM
MLNRNSLALSKRTAVVFITIAILAVVIWGMWCLRGLVFLVFSAYLLMLALQKPIRALIKYTHLPRAAAVFLAYVLFFALVALLLVLTLPSLTHELQGLTGLIGGWMAELGWLDKLSELNFTLAELGEIFNQVSFSFATIWNFIGGTFNTLVNIILLFVISIHFSLSHQDFYKKIYWFTDDEHRVHRMQKFVLRLEKDLGGWVIGQVLLMFFIGLLTFLGLWFLRVPYALPLGILAGVLEIVPNVGPTIAAVPAVIFAFALPPEGTSGLVLGAQTLVFAFVIQQLENMFVVPIIMKNTADVDPLISIILVMAGVSLFGVAGALLAIPFYIVLRTCYCFWVKKTIISCTSDSSPPN